MISIFTGSSCTNKNGTFAFLICYKSELQFLSAGFLIPRWHGLHFAELLWTRCAKCYGTVWEHANTLAFTTDVSSTSFLPHVDRSVDSRDKHLFIFALSPVRWATGMIRHGLLTNRYKSKQTFFVNAALWACDRNLVGSILRPFDICL